MNSLRVATRRQRSHRARGLGFEIACGPLLGAQSWRLPFEGTSVLMIIIFGFVVHTVSEPETEREQGVRDVVGTFHHTGVLTNAVVGLLYTFGFFTLLAYTPLILGLTTLQPGSCSSRGGCY